MSTLKETETGSTNRSQSEPLISQSDKVQKQMNVGIRIDDESISITDLTDHYNEMTALLTNHGDTYYGRKRQFKKAKQLLEAFLLSEQRRTTTFHDVLTILRNNGISFHTFCAID